MMGRRVFEAMLLGAALGACTDLKRAGDEVPPIALPNVRPGDLALDAGVPDVADVPTPEADAGSPPQDFACEAWTRTTKSAECAPRQVRVVDPDIAIDVNGIAITRTPAGRIAIAYNAEEDGATGKMVLAHFVPTDPSVKPELLTRSIGFAMHMGYGVRLASTAPDVVHVLTHDVDDGSGNGDLSVVRLVDGKTPFSAPDLVVSALARRAEIAFAVDPAGTSWVTARMATGKTTAKLAAFRKSPGAEFQTLPDVANGLLVAAAPRSAETSLVVDKNGQLQLLYHHVELPQFSTPRYHAFDGQAWSYRKTVDNAVVDGRSGFGATLGVFGNKKIAAYFFRKAAQAAVPTADLRLATWELASDTPKVEILDQTIPSSETMDPRYRVAMKIDRFGLVHLVVVRPSDEAARSGTLEYRRQVRTATGETKWLSDIVDPEVLSETSGAEVALTVDDAGRPHIAYVSGRDLKVRYATRYDR